MCAPFALQRGLTVTRPSRTRSFAPAAPLDRGPSASRGRAARAAATAQIPRAAALGEGPGPSESGWQSAVSIGNLDNAPACLDSEVVARGPSAVPGGDFTTARYPSLLFAHNFVRDESQSRASGLKTPSAQLSTGMAPL